MNTTNEQTLPAWMHFVLKFAGYYNLLAGAAMMILYHEGYKMLGVAKPEFVLPIQLVGLLVGLFGIGYLMVDRRPSLNQNVLWLGLMSKLLGPLIALPWIFNGTLPIAMLVVLFFADTIYVWPFWKIYQTISRSKQEAGRN